LRVKRFFKFIFFSKQLYLGEDYEGL